MVALEPPPQAPQIAARMMLEYAASRTRRFRAGMKLAGRSRTISSPDGVPTGKPGQRGLDDRGSDMLPATVVTSSVAVDVVPPTGTRELGTNEHFTEAGRPEHASEAELVKPLEGAILRVYCAVSPGEMFAELGDAESEKSTPKPVRTVVCGLLPASSTTTRVPVSGPAVSGAKAI